MAGVGAGDRDEKCGREGDLVPLRYSHQRPEMMTGTTVHTFRYEKEFETHVPVMVHVNYHPDKFARMQSIWARYVEGDMHALDKYPVSRPKTVPEGSYQSYFLSRLIVPSFPHRTCRLLPLSPQSE